MSIRIRRVGGQLVACCAARSIAKPGDIYLDDEAHQALTWKFRADFSGEDTGHATSGNAENDALREREESNNPNREWWDSQYAEGVEP